ncbi:hypothetical protein SASPL_113142 [Salvia splendens]|uniref:Disease resistance R13L4/SHOC-2-like LRR domain-containing protein n=1 Tax=Salvia splendens TaxID=180675 RepID=A0A8X8Y427_SALSN|nr:hypothetical protein SASPL_113142 [Salvia splendens]
MAYNLQTLITILEGILDPDQPRWVVDENNPQLRSLLDKATSLQQLVDKSSLTKIDSQIRQVAHQAHDIIESHMVNHMLSGSNCVRFTFSTPDLQQVTRDLDSVIEQVKKLVEMEDKKMLQELDSATEQVKLVEVEDKKMPSSSSSSVVVGIDADLMQLKDRLTDNGPELTFSNPRRVSFDISNSMDNVNVLTESMALTRSVIGIGDSQRDEIPPVAFFSSRLLTVLDLMYINFEEFPTEIFEFVNLRFLSIWCRSRIPRGISRLQNLQTLIGYVWFDVSSELWQLSELRNLNVREIQLLKDKEMNYCVLKKLQIISVTTLTREAETWDGFLKSIPNIKKLGIDDGYSRRSTAIDLSHLLELEILRCNYIRIIPFADGSDDCSKVTFPCNIRKLVLCGCEINSRVLGTLCELRKLEVLKISACSFKREEETSDEEWEVAEGDEFPSLQFLYLEFLILLFAVMRYELLGQMVEMIVFPLEEG